MPDHAAIEVILLAAGTSARMGGTDKRMLPIHGEPLLRRSARIWLESGHDVLAVIRPDDAVANRALAGLPVRLVANPRAHEGQHTSALAGLAAARLETRALAFALADQPLLDGADLAALLASFDAAGATRIVIPRHAGARGNPVVWPAALARRLRDDPASGPPRAFIDANPALVAWHEAGNDHFTTDIDTPEDAARVLAPPCGEPLP